MTIVDWFKNENNPSLPKSEYLYGTRHIILLVLTVLLCLGVYFVFRKKSEKSKTILCSIAGKINTVMPPFRKMRAKWQDPRCRFFRDGTGIRTRCRAPRPP